MQQCCIFTFYCLSYHVKIAFELSLLFITLDVFCVSYVDLLFNTVELISEVKVEKRSYDVVKSACQLLQNSISLEVLLPMLLTAEI